MLDYGAVHLALRTQLVTLDSLPETRSWENRRSKPVAGSPTITESFVPATHTYTGHGSLGGYSTVEGLYVLSWSDVADDGLRTLSTRADEVLALFPPDTALVAPDGPVVTIRKTPVAPFRGQIMPLDPGRAVVTITIPWRATVRIPAVAA